MAFARFATTAAALILMGAAGAELPGAALDDQPGAPTFYRNVLPILQDRCQSCHRADGIAPMPLVSYADGRRWATAIAQQTDSRRMPPWFADARFGRFSNDPSLTADEIATLARWASAGAPAGDPRNAPPPRHWSGSWNIPQPDRVIAMPVPVQIPAHGDVEYTYEIVPTGFERDTWVRMSQVLPSSPAHVHHAVVYIRPPDSNWLRRAPAGVPFTASIFKDPRDRDDATFTKSDILLVYAPGSSPERWPDTMGKLIPAGSDLVFQMHYTTNGHAARDFTSIGLVFNRHPPAERVLTLQLTNDRFVIPPGVDDFRVEVHGTLPNDCTLLGFLPHMHLRGKRFEYNIVHPGGKIETLLRVNYDFYWQLSYRLAEPRVLKAGTELQAVAWYDNSARNPHNPDPTAAVYWGDQTYDEMMVGFFDVAVPAGIDKQQFFLRSSP
jgi:Copper type II ascorbate-dependent monooxygenase, C-terminal domain